MSFLIEKDGERRWTAVRNFDDGWSIIKEGAGAKPQRDHKFVNGEWVPDAPVKAAFDRRARFMGMDREELVDFILGVIKRGDARLDAVEARLAALEGRLP